MSGSCWVWVLLVGWFCWAWGRNHERQRVRRDLGEILNQIDPLNDKLSRERYGELLSQAWRALRGDK